MSSTARDVAGLIGRYFHESAPSGLISAYLFGSHVAGRAHRESDVDVAVLLAWNRYSTARDRFVRRIETGSSPER